MQYWETEAYAKINLGLDVVRRLENGYHQVRMVMQTVDISDTIRLERCAEGIHMTSDCEEAPGDIHNLAYRAAALFLKETGAEGGVKIRLTKRIPVAAGMAGGSTDAAAVLRGMNELFETGLSVGALCSMGVKLGADVPYCISGGTALAEGIGEVLTALPDAPKPVLLVAKPEISVSTKYVYEHLLLNERTEHPDIDGMVQAVRDGNLAGIIDRMGNVLEGVTGAKYPVIGELKAFMEENGAVRAMMSGSGPTVFGIYPDRGTAERAAALLAERGTAKQIFVTSFH